MRQGDNSTLRAGAAQLDVTPPLGTQIGPRGLHRPAREVLDPLYGRALVLESQGRRLCLVSLDVRTVGKDWADKTRKVAAERFGLQPEAIMIHAVQNHASPRFGARMIAVDNAYITPELSWLLGGSEEYNAIVMDRILLLIERALDALEPASLAVGSGLEERVAHNRRNVMRDGSAQTLALQSGDPNILYAEGPIDPEVGLLQVRSATGKPIALLLHHTCHPCHGNGDNRITAGWPGAWSREMCRAIDEEMVSLVINGFCGNIHHRSRRHRDPTHGDDYHELGRMLADVSLDVLQNDMRELNQPTLDWGVQNLAIPLRELNPETVESARKLLDEHPQPMWTDEAHTAIDWSWFYAIALLDLVETMEKHPLYDYQIQAFRIGDVAIVGMGGEPFVEGQLAIKLHSPAYRTFCVHMVNDAVGYIPTKHAFDRGGYETRTGDASKLAPEALNTIVEATAELLQELFAN